MLDAPAVSVEMRPASRAAGRIQVPGDKSISHRYALLAALARGTSVLHNYSPGADCAATLACLRALGVAIEQPRGRTVRITGHDLGGLAPPQAPLDAANSGTTLRLLAGVLAAHAFETVIGGDASLSRRPMTRVITPLVRMGAAIESDGGRPPLTIRGGPLDGIAYRPEVPSAQVKSAVLLAGLQAAGSTTVTEPAPTRDHTERALRVFGARVEQQGLAVSVGGGQRLEGRELAIPGDISSAVFWMALAAATPGGDIVVEGVGLNPTRTAVLDVLRRAGAVVEIGEEEALGGEPVGQIRVRAAELRSFAIEPAEVPGLIDEIPALAALGARLPHGEWMTVRGAAELRVKESDRISMLARGFRAMGTEVEEYADGFRLTARPLRGTDVDSAGDHRLAMAFAIAAAGASSGTTIRDAGAVGVSYPGFFEEYARLISGDGR